MSIQSSFHPELVAALEKQKRYTDNSSDDATVQKSNLFRKLGTLAGAIYTDELALSNKKLSQPDQVRVYTFKHNDKNAINPAEVLTPPQENGNGETVSVPFKIEIPNLKNTEFHSNETTWIIGYDIETQAYNDARYEVVNYTYTYHDNTPSHCVSHQWYFNFQGIRFGFIFLTNHRISQADFVTFLQGAIPKIEKPEILSKVKVYAHFSVYESGWMFPSPAKIKPNSTKKTQFALLINERSDEWYGCTELRTFKVKPGLTKTGKASKAKPTDFTIQLEFGDSNKLQAGSLKKLGETIGIDKKELPDSVISDMAKFLTTNPKTFCEYAIIDSVIAAEAHLYFFYKYKNCMLQPDEHENAKEHMRMPGYSSDYFRGLYKKKYGDKEWKKYLGYDDNGMTLSHKAFVHFYHGGRNDVLSVGPRGEAHYLDLHSAYLTSVVMLDDYDFSRVRVTTGAAAEKRLEELYNDGPFQVVGIECSFQFNDKGKPIFPVRIDEAESLPGVRINFNSDGIIYPKSGKSNLTMPEYWVARNNSLIEKIIVHRVIEFVKVEDPVTHESTHWFADEVLRLLKSRKDSNESDKLFYKNILNFFYGKTAQGVKASANAIKAHNFDRFVNVSSMTCYPLASYITGFCRATVGELLQHNECYGITTDGFITPVSRENLVIHDNSLCDRVQKKLHTGGFNKNFIGSEASGNRSLFLKTRGYMLIKDKPFGESFVGPPTQRNKLQKMAAMGAKIYKDTSIDPIKDFLEILKKGYSDKKYFVKLRKIREEQKRNPFAIPELRTAKDVRTNMTFDMKHLPSNPTTEYFEWDGEKYPFVSFETKPLDTATDFHILRALRGRDYNRDIPKELFDPEFPFKEIPEYSEDELNQIFTEFERLSPSSPPTTNATPTEPITPPAPKKIKTMMINGKKMPRTIAFNMKTDIKTMIELGLTAKTIPTYMELPDYKRMLAKFDEYRTGENTLQLLDTSADDDADMIPDEILEPDETNYSNVFDEDE